MLAGALLATQAALSLFLRAGPRLIVYNNGLYFLVLLLATGIAARNAIRGSQSGRLFWSLLAAGMGLWGINPLSWIYCSVVAGQDYPEPAVFSFPLFLHIVLLLAAAAARPHLKTARGRAYRTTLNFLLLLFFWVFLYAFLMLPFLRAPVGILELRFEGLYFAENLFLLAALGFLAYRTHAPWNTIYQHLLGASTLYAAASLAVNMEFARPGFSAGLIDIPYTAAGCWFVWAAVAGWKLGPELTEPAQPEPGEERYGSLAANIALLCIPLIGLLELFREDEPAIAREARLMIVLVSVAVIAALVSLQNYVASRHLVSDVRELSERRFSEFFTTLPEYCYITSPGGQIMDANPAACEALGYSREEMRGRPLTDIYAPESFARRAELFEQWKRTGTIHNEEMVILTRDGRRRTVLLNAGSVKDAGGNILHSASVQVDITERKQLQERLHDSQGRLQGIVDSAMDAIIAVDEHQRIMLFNPAAELMFGCKAGDVLGTSLERFLPDRFRSGHREHIRQFGESGTTSRALGTLGALRALRSNGEEFPIEASISQAEAGGRKLFTVIVRDETQRSRVEAALRESEERFRLVANAAPVMIWMSGPDKQCDYFNQPWLEFTGRTVKEELGQGWAEGVHPEDLRRCLETYGNAFERRETFEMEYRLRRHDGEYRWVYDLGVPRFSADGAFAGYIGSCHDVTERKRAAEALSTVSQRLIEAHEEERKWIARELHDDINQRVALLAVALECLKQSLSHSPQEAKRQVREAYDQVVQLGSEIQALSHRLHSSKLEYLGLAAAAAGFCKEFAERQKMEIAFHSEDMPQKLAPEVGLCLFRVLQEAIQNAAKHSQARSIEVALTGAADQIQLLVQDSGIGFDPEAALNGEGLGLTSMKERLRLVQGELSIESGPSRGTSIRARVPLVPVAKSAQVAG
jgi:PAS domain S-box-containing protein